MTSDQAATGKFWPQLWFPSTPTVFHEGPGAESEEVVFKGPWDERALGIKRLGAEVESLLYGTKKWPVLGLLKCYFQPVKILKRSHRRWGHQRWRKQQATLEPRLAVTSGHWQEWASSESFLTELEKPEVPTLGAFWNWRTETRELH